jgi:hemerythrin-like domain-containing protein
VQWLLPRAELCSLLTSHVAVEEDALYPLLAATGDLTCETYDSLEEEHRALHDALEEQRFDRRAFYALAAHIEQEEMELFPAAMFSFDDDQWATLETTQRSVLLATS